MSAQETRSASPGGPRSRVAVLGLGRMGHAIASRLLDVGYRPLVWNRTPGRGSDLVGRGAAEAGSVDEAMAGADVIITSLTGDEAVAQVLLADGTPRSAVHGIVIDCSTVSPATTLRLADAYPGRFVACPIAGAPALVQQGHALLMIGAPAQTLAGVERVLADLSDAHLAAGTPARASVIKLINNYLLLGGLALLADAVAAGQRCGLDPESLRALLGRLPVVAPGVANRIEGLIGSEHDGWFPVELGAKDLRLFGEVFGDGTGDLGLDRAVRDRYEAAARQGLGSRDVTAVIEPIRGGAAKPDGPVSGYSRG